MRGMPRRQFVRSAAGAGALVPGRAPAFAQRRELTFLSGSHFKRVMEWGQDQVVQAVRGQLKASG